MSSNLQDAACFPKRIPVPLIQKFSSEADALELGILVEFCAFQEEEEETCLFPHVSNETRLRVGFYFEPLFGPRRWNDRFLYHQQTSFCQPVVQHTCVGSLRSTFWEEDAEINHVGVLEVQVDVI